MSATLSGRRQGVAVMDRRDDSLGNLPAAHKEAAHQRFGELLPCPCGLLAPVLPPPPKWTFPELRCARGHFTVLTPAVHDELLSHLGAAFS
jgi:hypothetical protein